MSDLISIIVLTLNSERYIHRCLDALLAQSYRAFEVVIVDAGSVDSTGLIVRSYEDRLLLRFIVAKNTNMGQARNIGIENAYGNFLAFCDSDDFYAPEKLRLSLQALIANPGADASYGVATHFRSNDTTKFYLARRLPPLEGNLASAIVRSQTINLNTLLIRRTRMNKVRFPNDVGGKYGEDWQYLVNLVVAGARFCFVKGRHSMIEVRTDSHTSWKIQHLMKWYVIRHLILHRSGLHSAGVSAWRWRTSLTLHWLKFCLSCSASEDTEFLRKARFCEFGGRPIVVKVFELLFMPFARSRFFSHIVRCTWVANRNIKVWRAKVGF
jgi:glycosyltransferase involved in cell wall biosynthesis